MLLFLDTEFTELTSKGELISLALVSEDHRAFYAEITDYDTSKLTSWHLENVIPHLFLELGLRKNNNLTFFKGQKDELIHELTQWLSYYNQTKCKIVADVYMYDWVFFADLFGGALHLPKMLHFIPIDFATILLSKKIDPNIKRIEISPKFKFNIPNYDFITLRPHNALYDCLLLKTNYEKIM